MLAYLRMLNCAATLDAGVIENSFADYLRTFTDQPAVALEDLVDGHGYQRPPLPTFVDGGAYNAGSAHDMSLGSLHVSRA